MKIKRFLTLTTVRFHTVPAIYSLFNVHDFSPPKLLIYLLKWKWYPSFVNKQQWSVKLSGALLGLSGMEGFCPPFLVGKTPASTTFPELHRADLEPLLSKGEAVKKPPVQFSCSAVSNSLRPHEPQHARPACPSPTPGVRPNSCPLSRWCHPTISSSMDSIEQLGQI